MCNHCYKVHYPSYNHREACDLARLQRKKFEEDIDRNNNRPTLKTNSLALALISFFESPGKEK